MFYIILLFSFYILFIFLIERQDNGRKKKETKKTRTVRKSDYTPALALPKHMAGIFDEKCTGKEKCREEQIGEGAFSIPCYNLRCEPIYQI